MRRTSSRARERADREIEVDVASLADLIRGKGPGVKVRYILI